MKKILSAIVTVAFIAVASSAVAAPPPAEVVLKGATQAPVTFNHKLHQGQGCKKCHGEGSGRNCDEGDGDDGAEDLLHWNAPSRVV